MFRIVAVVLLAFLPLSPSFAADIADKSEDVTSLNFYTHEGRYYLVFRDQQSIDNHSNNTFGFNSSTNVNIANIGGSYGLGNGMRITLSESYLIGSTENQASPTGAMNQFNSTGFSDPTIAFLWRYLEINPAGFSGDVFVSLTPSLGHRQTATKDQTGNDLNGYSEVILGTSLFHRHGNNEAEAVLNLAQLFSGHSDGPLPSNTYTSDPRTIVSINVYDRYHLNDDWFLQGGLQSQLDYADSYNYDSGVSRNVTYPFYINPRIDFGYSPSADKLVTLNFLYHHAATSTTGLNVSNSQTDIVNVTTQISLLVQF
jgi:hypothetical protein